MSDAPQTTPKTMLARQVNPVTDRGARGFLIWLKTAQPRLYAQALPKIRMLAQTNAGLSGVFGEIAFSADYSLKGDATADIPATSTAPSKGWADTIKDLLIGASSAYLTKEQIDSQKKVLDMQLERARNGLAPLPIDPSEYGLAPTARVGLTGDTKTLLMYGASAGIGLWLLSKLMGRRRGRA